MRFWYEWYEVAPIPTGGGSTDLYRPEIEFRVIGAAGDTFLLGLLDTGAGEDREVVLEPNRTFPKLSVIPA